MYDCDIHVLFSTPTGFMSFAYKNDLASTSSEAFMFRKRNCRHVFCK